MKTIRTIAVTTLAAFTLIPLPAQAQAQAPAKASAQAPAQPPARSAPQTTPQTAAQLSAHADLYAALNEGIDHELVLETSVHQVVELIIQSDPEVAQAEAETPGLLLELTLAMRPVLRSYQDRVEMIYTPQFIAVLADVLTEQEAIELAGFYRSDLGRRLLTTISQNVDSQQALDQSIAEQDITAEALQQDDEATLNNSVSAFMGGLTEEELMLLANLATDMPAIGKMPEFQQRSLPIRVAMENEPLSAEEERALSLGAQKAYEKYLEREIY